MAKVDYRKELEGLLDVLIEENGSDLHLSVKSHPMIRIDGSLVPLSKKPVLVPEDAEGFAQVARGQASLPKCDGFDVAIAQQQLPAKGPLAGGALRHG